MNNEKQHNKDQNEYAKTIEGSDIFIYDAKSGKLGYYCIGCKCEMQAVRSKIIGRKSYFRHDPTDVKRLKTKCTFSNETYRHNQAKLILNRIKKIKVPSLYKYPPKDEPGIPILIKKSEFIFANKAKLEMVFYENNDGEIKFGRSNEVVEKNLLIRPDVSFFNKDDEPILLIEIVVKHKITNEKLAKIKRLGIDTVQIVIPKDSIENIEKNFSSTNNIKWIHNNEQERTDYIFTPERNAENVLPIDELQRDLFEETYECRRAQISNLIRSINRSLETEHYRRIEQQFESELQRVKGNTEQAKDRLEKRREGIRKRVEKRVDSEFEPRRISNESKRSSLETKSDQLRKEEKELNEDFNRTKGKLVTDFEDQKRKIEDRYNQLEGRYFKRREELGDSIVEQGFPGYSEKTYREEIQRIERDIEEERKANEYYKKSRNRLQETFEAERRAIEKRRINLPEVFERKGREVEARFDENRESGIKQIQRRDTSGSSKLSGRIKEIANARSLLDNWEATYIPFKRNRKAWDSFREGTFKNWN